MHHVPAKFLGIILVVISSICFAFVPQFGPNSIGRGVFFVISFGFTLRDWCSAAVADNAL